MMIREAVQATRAFFGEPPALGMVTFIDRSKVKPVMVRGKPTWGRTWKLVGFQEVGETKQANLLAMQLLPDDMPPATYATNGQLSLWEEPR